MQDSGLALSFAVAAIKHNNTHLSRADVAEKLLPGDAYAAVRRKAETEVGTTTRPGFGAELMCQEVREFIGDLESTSVFAQLSGRGVLSTFGGANSVTWPRRDEAARGSMKPAWISDSALIPVNQTNLLATTLNRFKLGAITTASNELLRVGNPDILDLMEGFIRQDLSEALDGFLLDPAHAGSVAVQPASIINSAPNQASVGDTLADVVTDFKWFIAQASTARMLDPVILLHSDRMTGLQMIPGTSGKFPLRSEIAAGSLFGLPLISSPFVPAGLAILVDTAALKITADPVEVDVASGCD